MIANEFDIAYQFRLYLERCGLNIHRMPPYQLRETSRAFYGAWGMLLVVLRDNLTQMEEGESLDALQSMQEQVEKFWTAQTLQQ